MADSNVQVSQLIQDWLTRSHQKISSFWIGADWHIWARYELYMELDKALGSDYLVQHGVEIWTEGDEEVDILLESRNDAANVIAIKLRCERVSENEGSFEKFRDQLNSDVERIKRLGILQPDFQGAKILLVGFSGPPIENDDGSFGLKVRSEPIRFSAGEVSGWIVDMGAEPA